MTQLPAPLVPPEVDLQDFAFMPLDVQRLRNSELASDVPPEGCWAALLLWCASWHEIPAGSIPDNNQWQAKVCGYVARGRIDPAWNKIKEGALHGFVLCEDGRLYHPVVAEKVREAWRSKLQQRWKTEAARIKKHNQRHRLEGENALVIPDFEEWLSLGCPQGQTIPVPKDNTPLSPECPQENQSKRQGEGQGLFKNTLSPERERLAETPERDDRLDIAGLTGYHPADWQPDTQRLAAELQRAGMPMPVPDVLSIAVDKFNLTWAGKPLTTEDTYKRLRIWLAEDRIREQQRTPIRSDRTAQREQQPRETPVQQAERAHAEYLRQHGLEP